MSEADLLQFHNRVLGDAALQAEVRQALGRDAAAVVDIGAREGFQFTESELLTVLDSAAFSQQSGLNDEDLDLVTGGGSAPVNSASVTGNTKS